MFYNKFKENIEILTGILFGIGLSISEMINPMKIKQFLTINEQWSPDLLIVMASAVIFVFIVDNLFRKKMEKPLYSDNFNIPQNKTLDKKLMIGSLLFGFGWAVAGYCPGPLIVSFSYLSLDALIFFIFYILGTTIILKLKKIQVFNTSKIMQQL